MFLKHAALLLSAHATTYFEDNFNTYDKKKWTPSTYKGKDMGEWVHTAGDWYGDETISKGLMTSEDMRWHAISAPLSKAASTVNKKLVIQFSVKNERKEYAFCGGGYIKLLSELKDPKSFGGESPYAIMFGPDLCGYDVSRIHLIFNHKGENLLKEEDIKLDYDDKNEFTHLYTMVLEADGTYEVFLDQKSKIKGAISDDWAFPSKEIKDPKESKPKDWVDEKKIPDPAAAKPEGYDDIPAEIPDPEAEVPDDWDEEEDGEWESPMIDNPDYKGEWSAPMIENPDYKGEWIHPMIPNKDYDPKSYAQYNKLTHVGFELWTVNNGSIFDNILITDDYDYAVKQGEATWGAIKDKEKDAKDAWKKLNEPEESEDEGDADDDDDEDDVDEDGSEDEL